MAILVLTFTFIMPLNVGMVFAEETKGKSDTTVKTNEEVGNDCNLFPPLNPKDSIIMSAATLCLPGLLEKANEWRQIQCEEVVCMYNAITNSLDPIFCGKQAAYSTCKYVYGEIFALPYVNLVEKLREKVAEIIANPAAYFYSVAIALVREYMAGCYYEGSCDSFSQIGPALLLAANDIAAGIQTFIDMFENGFGWSDDSTDYCEQIDDIKTEMQKVIDGTSEDDDYDEDSDDTDTNTNSTG